MDVVAANGKDFLSEFVESLGTETVREEIESVDEDSDVSPPTTEVNQPVDVWTDIEEALCRRADRILDTESRYEKTGSFRESIVTETTTRRFS